MLRRGPRQLGRTPRGRPDWEIMTVWGSGGEDHVLERVLVHTTMCLDFQYLARVIGVRLRGVQSLHKQVPILSLISFAMETLNLHIYNINN